MARSSVVTFSALWRAYGEGRLERSLDLIDPECSLVTVEGRTYHGHDGVTEWLTGVRREWKTLMVTYESVEEPYVGWAVGIGRVVGASIDGAETIDAPLVCVGGFRDGRLVHGRAFETVGDALRYARERAAGDPGRSG
jgi:hypothetical protein